MSVQETRIRQLIWLISEEYNGKQRELADVVGLDPSMISQLKTRARPFGEKIARKIEKRTDKPQGWLDIDHASAELTAPGFRAAGQIGSKPEDSMSPQQKALFKVLDQARLLNKKDFGRLMAVIQAYLNKS